MPDTVALTPQQIFDLARDCLLHNGCDAHNANAVASTVADAERDGSISHGLFRLPGYVAALRSGKVNGAARPSATMRAAAALRVDGDGGFAPTALQFGIPKLADLAEQCGVGVMALVRAHHFAALWHEVESLAERGLVGIACTAYMPAVAPAGAREALFGTNPIAFAWPRPDDTPVVFDMATASMAMGEVQIAARDGHEVPLGTGLDADGAATTDPAKIADGGVLLPFGGHKGSVLSMMIELLAAALLGERFSFEAKEADNGDGGPPRGGEFVLALSPRMIADDDWAGHADAFFARLGGLDGARLPGSRRHRNREDSGPREVNAALLAKVRGLLQ